MPHTERAHVEGPQKVQRVEGEGEARRTETHRGAVVLRALQVLREAFTFTHGRRVGKLRTKIEKTARVRITY